jgi:alkanesulfonate monooxygenase SsuD/methylene tetrahydromethanopterin reductase-like flavin-dependent oxidoreductase (luciferase family)
VQRTLAEAKTFYANVKALAKGFDRDPDGLIVLPGLYPVIGSTEAEARARKAEMDALLDVEQERAKLAERFGIDPERLRLDHPFPNDILDHVSKHVSRGFVENIVREANNENLTIRQVLGRNPHGGHRIIAGTPEQIADDMEAWFQGRAADGFNLNMDAYPSGLELFVDHVVPELRRRGLFRHEYDGTTLRDHLGLSYPRGRSVNRPLKERGLNINHGETSNG